jgi:CheY-like chemotaxis protein
MKKFRVLVAVPNEAALASYREVLTRNGFEVDTTTNGLDCVAKLRCLRPDVLALDPDLPWGENDGVLSVMQEESDVPYTPMLFLYSRMDYARLDRKGAEHQVAVPLNAQCIQMLASMRLRTKRRPDTATAGRSGCNGRAGAADRRSRVQPT